MLDAGHGDCWVRGTQTWYNFPVSLKLFKNKKFSLFNTRKHTVFTALSIESGTEDAPNKYLLSFKQKLEKKITKPTSDWSLALSSFESGPHCEVFLRPGQGICALF